MIEIVQKLKKWRDWKIDNAHGELENMYAHGFADAVYLLEEELKKPAPKEVRARITQTSRIATCRQSAS